MTSSDKPKPQASAKLQHSKLSDTSRVRRSFIARRIPHVSSRQRRVNIQDDGHKPPQERGHLTRLRAGRGAVPRSCGCGATVTLRPVVAAAA